jgi:hypothetical protein
MFSRQFPLINEAFPAVTVFRAMFMYEVIHFYFVENSFL